MKTDDVLSRMYAILYAMASDPTLLNPSDSAEITRHLKNFQGFLLDVVSARASKPVHISELDTFHRILSSLSIRLEVRLTFSCHDIRY